MEVFPAEMYPMFEQQMVSGLLEMQSAWQMLNESQAKK
jgi:hypothetical protein